MINHVERAYRTWPILLKHAQRDELVTYGELAKQIGVHHRAIRYILGVIQAHCMDQQLPPLTILVINATTGIPGHGFVAWSMDDLERGRSEVAKFEWSSLDNPFVYAADGTTEEGLVDSLVSGTQSADAVYARVKVRGTAQAIFRKALLRTYECQCAFCQLSFEDALEGAHLIPWGQATAKERMDPTNGILLCSTHHRLFDNGFITVSKSGRIISYDPERRDGPYSSIDAAMTVGLHRKQAALPKLEKHRPSDEALSRHHKIHEWSDRELG